MRCIYLCRTRCNKLFLVRTRCGVVVSAMAWLSYASSSASIFASRTLSQPYTSLADIGEEYVCGEEDTNRDWFAGCLSCMHGEGVGGKVDLLWIADKGGVQLSNFDSVITSSPGCGV